MSDEPIGRVESVTEDESSLHVTVGGVFIPPKYLEPIYEGIASHLRTFPFERPAPSYTPRQRLRFFLSEKWYAARMAVAQAVFPEGSYDEDDW